MVLSELLESASQRLIESFSKREKKRIVNELVLAFSSITDEQLMLSRNTSVSDDVVNKVNTSIDRINSGEPFQYVVGKTFFYDQEFKVDARALIPRPETEELVNEIVKLNRKMNLPQWNILDVGTGTGCIAISLKLALTNCLVTGMDVSEEAIDLARENAAEMKANVNFRVEDIMCFEESGSAYHLIVSNPPYIPLKEKVLMKSHVVDREPEVALFVDDEEPLKFYERITDIGRSMLKNRGYLAFEVHENLAEDVKNYLFLKGYMNISIQQDLQGKDRMVFAQLINS